MLDKPHHLKPEERFRSVDFIAEEIFDAMPDFTLSEPTDGTRPETPDVHDNSNVINLFSKPDIKDTQEPARTETLRFTLLKALEDLMKAAESGVLSTAPQSVNTGPMGAEMLRGVPSTRSDEEMLASIRTLIRQQEQPRAARSPVSERAGTTYPEADVSEPPQLADIRDSSQNNSGSSVLLKKLFGQRG